MCRAIPRESITPITVSAIINGKAVEAAGASAVPIKKRVSFHETVDVYVIERLDAFAVREMFYHPSDYHRFRSECCLEKLEARSKQDPLVGFFQSIVSSIGVSCRMQQRNIMIQRRRQQQQSCSTARVQAAMRQVSPESIVRELAFVL
ncbi:expressed unknown protein [Seminavis robusta]|uniref:Uncharacterized protein n=1 Tax=Seminavis robusta TaxID=568900 RepID=A0A9N8H1V7_9STRA|nr:expressed unknown protein [Seminavis robusta]|eukprot:Sro24_g016400.1 n/a (148) ;mRNA; r:64569-65012